MNLDALKQAVLGANSTAAPIVNVNRAGANAFTQSAINNIDAAANQGVRANATKVAGNALYGGISQQATADSANAQAAHDKAVADAKQQAESDAKAAKDLQDPSKYSKSVNNSGGYDFYAPDGTKISAQDYAQVTGKHVTDVLKGSQNTVDQNFVQDYKEVQKLGELTQQGGSALSDYLKKNPDIQKQLNQEGAKTYSDVVSKFRSAYPQFFPQTSVNDIGNAKNNNTPINSTSGNSIIDKLKGFLGGL